MEIRSPDLIASTFILRVILPVFNFTFSEDKLTFGSMSQEDLQESVASPCYIRRPWGKLDKKEAEKKERGEKRKGGERGGRGREGKFRSLETQVKIKCI